MDGVVEATDYRELNERLSNELEQLQTDLSVAIKPRFELNLEQSLEFLRHYLWNTSIAWQTTIYAPESHSRKNAPERPYLEGWRPGTP